MCSGFLQLGFVQQTVVHIGAGEAILWDWRVGLLLTAVPGTPAEFFGDVSVICYLLYWRAALLVFPPPKLELGRRDLRKNSTAGRPTGKQGQEIGENGVRPGERGRGRVSIIIRGGSPTAARQSGMVALR